MAKMKQQKKDIQLKDINGGNISTEISSARLSSQSNLASLRNSVQDYPMASLKSAAEELKRKTHQPINSYQELQPMQRKNSEKRPSFAKRNLAINIPLDEFPKGKTKIESPVHAIEQKTPPRKRDPSPEEEMQVI